MRPRNNAPAPKAASASVSPAAGAEDHASSLSLGTRVSYSAGSYGFEDETENIRFPHPFAVKIARVTFSAEIPRPRSDGPAKAKTATGIGNEALRFSSPGDGLDPSEQAQQLSGPGDAVIAETTQLTPDPLNPKAKFLT